AGTNGKGSVSHFLASVLQEAGFKTGLYTSPQLKDFRERIRLNGKMIPEAYVVDFVNKNMAGFDNIRPSFFEMTIGLAFDSIAKEQVDISVLETGMGGRLDSTNVVNPELSVITNIGYDHMRFLGDTLEKIAEEKAGIIKKNVPVVIGETQEEVKEIFVSKAREMGAPISFADIDIRVENVEGDEMDEDVKGMGKDSTNKPRRGAMSVENEETVKAPKPRRGYILVDQEGSVKSSKPRRGDMSMDLEIPLLGHYQKKNERTAVQAIRMLNKKNFDIDNHEIAEGIKNVIQNTGIRGRWEVLCENPLTICDIGHNKDGLIQVVDQLNQTPHNKLHFVFGIVDDKNISDMLALLPKDAVYYFCKADIPRGLDEKHLETAGASAGLQGNPFNSVKDAFEAAQSNAAMGDLVFVGGSTFVVAEVL
ncbi:MAG: bifunctional folylpolyglutamate synthase/dihydrofolate synthase, partial [Bacteroidales bacterium]|nr:bifunctional folylpolyglutamate synthase/dihydrofolate synthase [Bacteroidales bacterium]